MNKDNFLYPRHQYLGKTQPEHLAFNVDLQKFSQQVCYTAGLRNNGKISSDRADKNIKLFWKQLQRSQKELEIGDSDFK